MNEFKIRCSAISDIMGPMGPSYSDINFIEEMNAREKPMTDKMQERYDKIRNYTPELPQGAKTYCKNWVLEQVYGRPCGKSGVYTKPMDKGNRVESEAIKFLGNYEKNFLRFEDEYLTGEPDIIIGDTVIDIKCPWDHTTMPIFETEIPNKGYWWQLQGYMSLTHKHNAELAYCLMTTPPDLVDEVLVYDDLPRELRIRQFRFCYDPTAIEQVHERVIMCREYIETLRRDLKLDEF